MQNDFELDEIVWAKVSGYPWWPGFVASKVPGKKYEIVFLSDLSKAFLGSTKIKPIDSFKPSVLEITSELS